MKQLVLFVFALLAWPTAFAADGDVDPPFGGAGFVRYAAPKVVPALFAVPLGSDDGSVIIAGGADTEVFVRRYRNDGSLDTAFGTRGTTFVPGFTGSGAFPPTLNLIRDPQG